MSPDDSTSEVARAHRPEDWLSAAETIRLVRTETLSHYANVAIAKRAHAGLIRAHAALIIFNESKRHTDVDVPTSFWWAEGHEALTQNWELGDFETWLNREVRIQAFGVRFHKDDVALMAPPALSNTGPSQPPSREVVGRPMSALWPSWVAELAALIHEEGVPPQTSGTGVDDLIGRISDRLAERGLETPARSTVQETAKAVLRRLREAGN